MAVGYGILMTINLAWPRAAIYGTDHWYFQYGAFVFTGVIVLVGLAYYATTQRRREPAARAARLRVGWRERRRRGWPTGRDW